MDTDDAPIYMQMMRELNDHHQSLDRMWSQVEQILRGVA